MSNKMVKNIHHLLILRESGVVNDIIVQDFSVYEYGHYHKLWKNKLIRVLSEFKDMVESDQVEYIEDFDTIKQMERRSQFWDDLEDLLQPSCYQCGTEGGLTRYSGGYFCRRCYH